MEDIPMEPHEAPDFLISDMRVLKMPEMTFFYVTNQPTPFANLDRDLDPMLSSLYEAKKLASLAEMGPDIVRYYKSSPGAQEGEPDLFLMEVGISVKPEVQPTGEAQVKSLPPYHCAGTLLWGSLAHIGEAYEMLMQRFKEAGLKHTGECREWNYSFESVDSPNNLMGIFMEIGKE
jgi:effector-binding domain-containing protein